MNRISVFTLSLGLLWLLSVPGGIAAEQIRVATRVNGSAKTTQVKGYPLLLQVTISNPLAGNRALDAIASGGTVPTGKVIIGKPELPFYKSLKFEANGQPLPVHILRESKENVTAAVAIDAQNATTATFGLDKCELNGEVTITASLPAQSLPADATAAALPVHITVVEPSTLGGARQNQANSNAARYFIQDAKYRLAEPFIVALEKTAPQTAATLNAEMLYGTGEYAEARTSCRKALDLYGKRVAGQTSAEPPLYLMDLLGKIDEKLYPSEQ